MTQPNDRCGGVSADHLDATVENIDRFLSRPDAPYKRTAPLPVPPGVRSVDGCGNDAPEWGAATPGFQNPICRSSGPVGEQPRGSAMLTTP
jgi:hypothetical protein